MADDLARDPSLDEEAAAFGDGATVVAGLDEVGRGAWAGPVTVGVVTIATTDADFPRGLRDSKLLSATKREALLPAISAWASEIAVGHASPLECDELGMTSAIALAARRALTLLVRLPDVVIIDGTVDFLAASPTESRTLFDPVETTSNDLTTRLLAKADRRCASVAAASVVAKQCRDGLMAQLADSYPAYGFDHNRGYPAADHRTALLGYGLTPLHRKSWRFVDDWVIGPNGRGTSS